jgi:hypothetical protein
MVIFQPSDDAPVSVLAALCGALAEPGRHSIISRDGELFIRPSPWRAHRFAKWRRRQPEMRHAAALSSLYGR